MNSRQRFQHVLSFKEYKGFKLVANMKERYKIGKVLGEGSFGQVRIAEHRQAKVKCAIKIIKKNRITTSQTLVGLMQDELSVLEDVTHPNIMRIYELLHDDRFFYIVSEFIKYGELFDYVIKRATHADIGAMSEAEVRHVAFQLFYALNYMHERKVMHRDIKPENILIESL